MPQDPFAQLTSMVNQQMSMMSQTANQLVMGAVQVLSMPLQLLSQGAGVFSAQMPTSEMVAKNIFGAGT